jgi:hypothetical protein
MYTEKPQTTQETQQKCVKPEKIVFSTAKSGEGKATFKFLYKIHDPKHE